MEPTTLRSDLISDHDLNDLVNLQSEDAYKQITIFQPSGF